MAAQLWKVSRPRCPRTMLAALLLTTLGLISPFSAQSVAAAGRVYYVDCAAGNDTAAGSSTATAWRTIARANQASLVGGDSLLLKRGCTWGETLRARWSGSTAAPITFGAYGSGSAPQLQNTQDQIYVTGSHQIFQDLQVRADPVKYDTQCQNARAGHRTGVRLMSGSSYNIVRRVTASDLFIGIKIETGSHHNQVLDNIARNNNMKSDDFSSDAGAVGISLLGDDNEVSGNTISGSDVCSRFYGRDGSAIEVYGGQRNRIHHNRAIDNNQFSELGNKRSADNTFVYNLVTSTLRDGHFLTTRGSSDASYGPVLRTKVYNNTVYLTGSASYALQCIKGCNGSVLSLKNNIIWSQDRIGYADAAFDEGNNIFWSPAGTKVYFPIASSSRKVDPQFVAPSSGDFHLKASSPAVDKGALVAVTMGYTSDFDGTSVPQGAGVDIGAFERKLTAPVSSPTVAVTDTFSRQSTTGWGTADAGGAYALFGPAADYTVNGAAGQMTLRASGTTRRAVLRGTALTDMDATFRVKASAASVGSSLWIYAIARSVDGGGEYRAKVRVAPDGSLWLRASRVTSGVERPIAAEQRVSTAFVAGDFLWVRAQLTGGTPTIRIRVWRADQAQPTTWQSVATDSTNGPAIGSVGVMAYISGNSAPVTVSFDDLSVTAL